MEKKLTFSLLEKAKQLPETPGVYLMKNKDDQVIYVGKAKALNKRVTSYFRLSKNHSKKVVHLVKEIADFSVIHVPSEFSALLLECQLIHEIRPCYNQLMNHYEGYGYFLLENQQLKIVDEFLDQKECFGPFYKKEKMKTFLDVANSLYRFTGPLQYANGIIYPYTKDMSPKEKEQEYQERLVEFTEALRGKNSKILDRLMDKVSFFAEKNDFSQANIWWEKQKIAAYFLRRNHQLLQANQNNLFLGRLLLPSGEKQFILYGKGEVLGEVCYKNNVSNDQALKHLLKKVPKKKWTALKAKPGLTKSDGDLFPIFFNYLNRNGEITRYDFPK